MPEESIRGRFVWYDLMTTDPEAAKAFYTAVTGWGTQVWEEMSYTMWTVGEKPIGGIMKLPDEAVAGGARPHWLAYVAVPDVDATIARARELGATVMVPPTDIPTVGRYSVFADPQGALIAAFTPASSGAGARRDAAGGRVLMARARHHRSRGRLGLLHRACSVGRRSTDIDMGPMGVYQIFGRRGVRPWAASIASPPRCRARRPGSTMPGWRT